MIIKRKPIQPPRPFIPLNRAPKGASHPLKQHPPIRKRPVVRKRSVVRKKTKPRKN